MALGCENEGCDEVIYSGDVQFNGSFTSVVVAPDGDVNDAITALETYFINLVAGVTTPDFELTDPACTGLSAGTYSYQQIVEAIITKLCEVNTNLGALDTDGVDLASGLTLPSCFSSFVGTTATALFEEIASKICTIEGNLPPQDTGVILDDGSDGYTFEEAVPDKLVNARGAIDMMKGIQENPSYVFEHSTPVYSPTSLNTTVKAMQAFVNNQLVVRRDTKIVTVTALKDVYFYLGSDGSISTTEVNNGDPTPATPSNSMQLYKMVTDASGVTSYTALFLDSAFNDPTFTIPSDYITTAMLKDGAVTGVKMEDYGGGANSYGDDDLFRISVDSKGRVTAVVANMNLSGMANGDIMVWDTGTGKWIVSTPMSFGTNGFIPLASGGDLIASSLEESGTQVKSNKKVEINTGVAEDDSECGLNVVTGTFKAPRFTATEASALTLDDGILIYVTSTNGTFTSVGFWGVVSGAWSKL